MITEKILDTLNEVMQRPLDGAYNITVFETEYDEEVYILTVLYSEEKECNVIQLVRPLKGKNGEEEVLKEWECPYTEMPAFLDSINEFEREVLRYIPCQNTEETSSQDKFGSGITENPFQLQAVSGGKKTLTPHEIVDYLNQYVIGQDNAKKALAVAVYNHTKRLEDTTGLIRKSNVLMACPCGTGKTLLAKTIAKLLDVPFAIADATSLTEAGYVGDDVENCLTRLLQAANGDIEAAEQGVIYIDEIDKIARKGENPSITRDVSGEGVQQALLKIIEGAEVSLPAHGGRKHPQAGNVVMDTSNILFIAGGAFEGMFKTEKKKTGGKLGCSVDNTSNVEEYEPEQLSTKNLVKFGMMPELIGRLPVRVKLDDIKKEDLVRILTEPKNSLCKEYQLLLQKDGAELVFQEDALEAIAEKALGRETGARGLRGIMEELMLDVMYDIPSDPTITKCILTAESVQTGIPELIRKQAV